MRILLWSDLFSPYMGGIEKLNDLLVRALQDRGHEVCVITSHHHLDLPDTTLHGGARVHRLPFRPAIAARDMAAVADARARAAAIERAFRPDVVHMTLVGPSSLFHGGKGRSSDDPPLVLTMQQVIDPVGPDGDSLMARVVRAADWVAACSRDELAALRRRFPEVTGRSSAIPNALPPPADLPSPLPFAPPRIVGLGRGLHRKGFDLAVEVVHRLRDRFPNLVLELITDGPERATLEDRARALDLGDRVEFPGIVPMAEVPAALNRATIVLLPSRIAEPFNLVALEAGLMGRPVVTTRVGGLPEVVADGETGIVVPPEDAEALAAAVASLLSDPDHAIAMGAAARRRALTEFAFDSYADAYETLYRRVSGPARQAG